MNLVLWAAGNCLLCFIHMLHPSSVAELPPQRAGRQIVVGLVEQNVQVRHPSEFGLSLGSPGRGRKGITGIGVRVRV